MPSNTSTSQHFAAVTSAFEESARSASYTVYEIQSDGNVLNSQFTSKNRAFDFARNHTSQSSQVYVYKTKCIKIFDADTSASNTSSSGVRTRSQTSSHTNDTFAHNVNMLIQAAEYINSDDDADYVPSGSEDDDDDYADMPDLEYDLTGLRFSDYGKGYLLRPSRSTTFTGVKYLNNGWWNQSQGGWFFRRQYFDDLLEAGATYTTGSTSTSSTRNSRLSTRSNATNGTSATNSTRIGPSPFEIERDLSGFTIEPYGRRVILSCSRSNALYKQKAPYLMGNLGWWNNAERGWFFKNQHVSELKRLGAVAIKQEPTSSSARSSTARSSSARSSSARSSSARSTSSARSSSDRPSSSARSTRSQVNFVTDDSQFMEDSAPAFEKYGKGYLLPASDRYTYAEHGKYFQGGFWMPKNNGWFFRRADRDAFVA